MGSANIALVIAGGEWTMSADGAAIPVASGDNESRVSALLPQELAASVTLTDWSHQPGSHYSVRMAADLIDLLSRQVAGGAHAAVVLCGADAVEEMAYLASLLWNYPQPLVFAVTHTPPDAPGSEAATVLREALSTAAADVAWGQGVLVCTGGQLFAAADVFEATNFGRNGFEGAYRGAIGSIVGSQVLLWQAPKRSRVFDAPFTPARHVELIYATLGGGERLLRLLTEGENIIDGLVLAGMGGGNIPPAWIPHIKTLQREGLPIVAASRCLRGGVLDFCSFEGSYSRLAELGIMSAGFLSPLQARLKLAVGIGAGLKGGDLQNYLLDR